MELNTASLVYEFAVRLEEKIAKFYEELASSEKYSKGKERFLSFAKEDRGYIDLIRRVYQGVITDAIEACYAFTGMEDRDYEVSTALTEDMSYSDVIGKALEIEQKAQKFFVDARDQGASFMADLPQAFNTIAKRRERRVYELRSLM